MKKILFFDTETTGLGEEDRLFQLAYKIGDEQASKLFKPPLPIHPGAAEVTGVSDEDVADKPPFSGSQMHQDFLTWSADTDVVFVAHNAPFDTAMMRKESVEIVRVIDTYKIARALDPEGQIASYKLESLCEHYGIDTTEFQAHDAMGDVLMLELLYGALARQLQEDIAVGDVVEEMLHIMSEPLLIRKMPFGKYKGALVEEIVEKDGGYLEWLLSAKRRDAEGGDTPDIDWIYTLSYYLGKECEYGTHKETSDAHEEQSRAREIQERSTTSSSSQQGSLF